jgi:DNA topoisomerase-1
MKKLLIVESPAKIKTIKKFLGNEFQIMSTMGHVKDLPKKRLGVTINDTVDIEYETLEGKDKTLADICKAASTSDAIYLAPDPDREGEIIAWNVNEDLVKVIKKGAKIHRITFNEITQTAIEEAIAHPSEIDQKKVGAQQARRVLDRWVGYEVSPILWRKIAPGLSAGRVQSVALRQICEREQEIRNFKPEEYWTVDGIFKHNKEEFIAQLSHIGTKKAEIGDQKTADAIVSDLKKESYIIDSVEDKTRKKNAPPPFMTSTLQQAAYNTLGFSVKKTMQVAQKLYEGMPLGDESSPVALITYMRTDSLRLSDTALKQAREYIEGNFTKQYLPSKANVFEKKGKGNTQDAHEAIRPIDVNLAPEKIKRFLPADAAKLYDLIWKRFIAGQMTSAEYAQRQVALTGGKYVFKVTGSTLIFDGFLKVYSASDDDEKEQKITLPKDLKAKDPVALNKVDPKQHFTQPPPRFTEASLVKALEKEGIGRPSTYAAILNTIRERSYTTLDERKRFVPTELGMTIVRMLVENLPHIMNVKFTAHMEEDLDKIANGEMERDELLKLFYSTFKEDVKKFGGDKKAKKEAIATGVKCPECDKEKLAIRFGKSGEFLGCMGYPECSFTSNFERDEAGNIKLIAPKKVELLDEKCPQCGKPLREIQGKFGPFKACSGYPECKYIHREKAKFDCPQCGGEVVQKVWRGGKFWGCDNYPKCKFAVFDTIIDKPCPKCKWPFLTEKSTKEGTETLCANKECGYKKEA